ncbi:MULTISPECIES: hypothetical protein [Stenotrophomonas]|uniref:Uncharacterized protein n=1 Tax=Stenotrophomonas lactitubi TaxID=2045214 RepID=A0AAW4GJ67_9GAMM|nr:MULTISPECIES: hypothetical protein [Stenotrophomonas]MBM9913970.1 hypothetical protein [Stenotrophomonas lactitubi]MBM9921963.1 hypothetical protein [Stenotrophomonas lactitubi]MBM9936528.1 hypothetical protein [Stenotrophomonas lactitubi]
MLIGYGQPIATVSVDGGSAANLQALVDGRPSSIARVNGGAGSVRLRLSWSVPTPVRIAAVLGLTCPAGTRVTLSGQREGEEHYDTQLGGNGDQQPVMELADGSLAAWFVLGGAPLLIGLQVEIEAASFDIGELVAMPAVEVGHQVGWSVDTVDPSIRERTIGGGLNVVERRAYRVLRVDVTPAPLAEARGGGLSQGMDLDRLRRRVAGGRRVVAVPRWRSPSGALDVAEIHATALYGQAVAGASTHLGGDYYGSAWTFEEIPPL